MDTVTAAACDIRDFYQHQPIVAGDPGDLLVPSVDLDRLAVEAADRQAEQGRLVERTRQRYRHAGHQPTKPAPSTSARAATTATSHSRGATTATPPAPASTAAACAPTATNPSRSATSSSNLDSFPWRHQHQNPESSPNVRNGYK